MESSITSLITADVLLRGLSRNPRQSDRGKSATKSLLISTKTTIRSVTVQRRRLVPLPTTSCAPPKPPPPPQHRTTSISNHSTAFDQLPPSRNPRSARHTVRTHGPLQTPVSNFSGRTWRKPFPSPALRLGAANVAHQVLLIPLPYRRSTKRRTHASRHRSKVGALS